MDEAHLREALLDGRLEVIHDDVEHVARLEAVQVNRVLDLENGDRLCVVVWLLRQAFELTIDDGGTRTASLEARSAAPPTKMPPRRSSDVRRAIRVPRSEKFFVASPGLPVVRQTIRMLPPTLRSFKEALECPNAR